jgi:hypothetical protein
MVILTYAFYLVKANLLEMWGRNPAAPSPRYQHNNSCGDPTASTAIRVWRSCVTVFATRCWRCVPRSER